MTERQDPQSDRRWSPTGDRQPTGRGPVMVIVPLRDDIFEVPGGKRLRWAEIERTRPITPPVWWCDQLSRRGTIPNALDWLRQKGFIIAGEPSGMAAVLMHNGLVVGRMSRPEGMGRTLSVHFDGWNDNDAYDNHTGTDDKESSNPDTLTE